MKPRYVIINQIVKSDFEKIYQLPYGYGNTIIYYNLNDAIKQLEEFKKRHKISVDGYVIEKHESGYVEIVYK
jgi:hypothetical protein